MDYKELLETNTMELSAEHVSRSDNNKQTKPQQQSEHNKAKTNLMLKEEEKKKKIVDGSCEIDDNTSSDGDEIKQRCSRSKNSASERTDDLIAEKRRIAAGMQHAKLKRYHLQQQGRLKEKNDNKNVSISEEKKKCTAAFTTTTTNDCNSDVDNAMILEKKRIAGLIQHVREQDVKGMQKNDVKKKKKKEEEDNNNNQKRKAGEKKADTYSPSSGCAMSLYNDKLRLAGQIQQIRETQIVSATIHQKQQHQEEKLNQSLYGPFTTETSSPLPLPVIQDDAKNECCCIEQQPCDTIQNYVDLTEDMTHTSNLDIDIIMPSTNIVIMQPRSSSTVSTTEELKNKKVRREKTKTFVIVICFLFCIVAIGVSVPKLIEKYSSNKGEEGILVAEMADEIEKEEQIFIFGQQESSTFNYQDDDVTIEQVLPNFTKQTLYNPTSPQSKALQWLYDDPNLDILSILEQITRFVLVTLYYSTNANTNWYDDGNWLKYYLQVCHWYWSSRNKIINCQDSKFSTLDLSNNNLIGTIPPELSLLSNNIQHIILHHNLLSGSIPNELFQTVSLSSMKHLTVLDLSSNSFNGTIPTTIGLIGGSGDKNNNNNNNGQLLLSINLSNNQLSGTIPTDIGMITKLQKLDLHGNPNLKGSIPQELCYLFNNIPLGGSLEELIIDCTNIQCSCNCTCSE